MFFTYNTYYIGLARTKIFSNSLFECYFWKPFQNMNLEYKSNYHVLRLFTVLRHICSKWQDTSLSFFSHKYHSTFNHLVFCRKEYMTVMMFGFKWSNIELNSHSFGIFNRYLIKISVSV